MAILPGQIRELYGYVTQGWTEKEWGKSSLTQDDVEHLILLFCEDFYPDLNPYEHDMWTVAMEIEDRMYEVGIL